MDLSNKGFELFRNKIDKHLIERINNELDDCYDTARNIQINNSVSAVTDGTIHHLPAYGKDVYIELIETIATSDLYEYIYKFFNGNFILNSYGGLKNLPQKPSYVVNIHRDIRFFTGEFPLMLNLLIMLDDFTLENGATYLLAGSHLKDEKPSDELFYKKSERALGAAGDILFFNSNLWHAAGINQSTKERRAITITFTKPFMKQQLDYPRAVGYNQLITMDEKIQQIFGYFSRTPENLNEWYQVPEKRFYRKGQD